MSDRAQYDALMEVVRSRMTVRAFDPAGTVPREHYELILEAARHSPSGANAQAGSPAPHGGLVMGVSPRPF